MNKDENLNNNHDEDMVSNMPKDYPLHIIIPLFGAFNIFLMAFIAVMMT